MTVMLLHLLSFPGISEKKMVFKNLVPRIPGVISNSD